MNSNSINHPRFSAKSAKNGNYVDLSVETQYLTEAAKSYPKTTGTCKAYEPERQVVSAANVTNGTRRQNPAVQPRQNPLSRVGPVPQEQNRSHWRGRFRVNVSKEELESGQFTIEVPVDSLTDSRKEAIVVQQRRKVRISQPSNPNINKGPIKFSQLDQEADKQVALTLPPDSSRLNRRHWGGRNVVQTAAAVHPPVQGRIVVETAQRTIIVEAPAKTRSKFSPKNSD